MYLFVIKLKLKERQTQKMPEVSLPIIQHGYQSSPTPTLETPRVTHSQEDQEAAATKTLAEIQGDKIKKEAETAGQKDQTESTDQTDMDKDHKEVVIHMWADFLPLGKWYFALNQFVLGLS